MNRVIAFGLVGPVIIALLGAFIYVPGVAYLNGQTSPGADTYQVAFVLFLVMGLVPEWLNLIIVALGRTTLRSSAGAGLFGWRRSDGSFCQNWPAFRMRTRSSVR